MVTKLIFALFILAGVNIEKSWFITEKSVFPPVGELEIPMLTNIQEYQKHFNRIQNIEMGTGFIQKSAKWGLSLIS